MIERKSTKNRRLRYSTAEISHRSPPSKNRWFNDDGLHRRNATAAHTRAQLAGCRNPEPLPPGRGLLSWCRTPPLLRPVSEGFLVVESRSSGAWCCCPEPSGDREPPDSPIGTKFSSSAPASIKVTSLPPPPPPSFSFTSSSDSGGGVSCVIGALGKCNSAKNDKTTYVLRDNNSEFT